MPNAAKFQDINASEIESLGGKGKNLVRLYQGGFPVPAGAVVFSRAYSGWLESIDWFAPEEYKFSYENPATLQDEAEALRTKLRATPLQDALRREISALLAGWPPETAFAVRSSSTFEDLGEAAFAGQHDTYLNCVGADHIAEKVRDCWISLWTDRAILYRHSRGFSHSEAAMAVVIQQQVACDVAGVAFSIHPVSGNLQTVAIDANYGLGESVVCGEYPVDHFEVDAKALRIASSTIAEKLKCIRPQAQGTKEEEIEPAKRSVPCLKEPQVLEVAKLAKVVQAHYSWPQDIEWGIAAGKLFLLQARPVTTIPPRWTRDESAERWPRAVTPLSWDYIDTAFRKSLSCSLKLMGLPVIENRWFDRLGYHVYGNQNAVELIRGYRPFRAQSAEDLFNEIPRLRESYAALIELPSIWMRDLDQYLLRIGALRAVSLDSLDARAVWEYAEQVATAAEDYFLPNIAISMTQGFLHGMLHHLLRLVVGEDKALSALDGLLAGIDCKTVEVNRELYELSRLLIKKVPEKEFSTAFEKFLERHGHREQLMDYSVPTWCDAPEVVLDLIGTIPADVETPAAQQRAARQKFADTEFAVLNAAPEGLRFFVKELVRLARLYTSLDDLEHYQTTRVNPLARRGALALGKILRAEKVLRSPDDIFFLHRNELAEIVGGNKELRKEAGTLAAARRVEFEQADAASPAWEHGEAASVEPSDGALRGIPGSPGVIEGVCFLVEDGSQFKDFPEGAILVARTTNPAWTPLFYRAAGLVTESGGPLSHGAVTAREMKLPAVMAVRGVMTRLRSGQRVRVDGKAGSVELFDK